jgi:hypothetical protein
VESNNFCSDTTNFSTITLMGRLVNVTESAEKKMAATGLRDSAEERVVVKNVAARHGFTDLDIKTLTATKSAIYKLEADAFVALKSPGR